MVHVSQMDRQGGAIMTLRVVADTILTMLDRLVARPPASAPRSPAAHDGISTLRNGQMLLPGIAEPMPWHFNPKA
jgi:hypothetical protein